MDELIKALANDYRIVEERRLKLEPFSNLEVSMYGKAYAFRVALGRTLLASKGENILNVDRVLSAADAYLKVSV